jgi:hypothetical protein
MSHTFDLSLVDMTDILYHFKLLFLISSNLGLSMKLINYVAGISKLMS